MKIKNKTMDEDKFKKSFELMKQHGLYIPPTIEQFTLGDKDAIADVFKKLFAKYIVKEYIHIPEYDQVISWLSDNKNKGLFLIGGIGTGKSIIQKSVIPHMVLTAKHKIIKTYNPRELSAMGRESFDRIIKANIISLDDIGREYIRNDYGNKFDPIVYAIEEAYDNRKMLIISSNMSKDEFIQRYGEHIFDRVKEVCNIVTIKHKSFR